MYRLLRGARILIVVYSVARHDSLSRHLIDLCKHVIISFSVLNTSRLSKVRVRISVNWGYFTVSHKTGYRDGFDQGEYFTPCQKKDEEFAKERTATGIYYFIYQHCLLINVYTCCIQRYKHYGFVEMFQVHNSRNLISIHL